MFHDKQNHQGFTIIELMLAMTFVAFILVFMSLTLVQMLRTYDKAVTLKQINQAGRSITEDINRVMRSQLPASVKVTNVSNGFMCIDKTVYFWRPLYIGTTMAGATPNANHNAVSGNVVTGPTMVRKTLLNANTNCGAAEVANAANFAAGSETPLLTSRARVIWANATPSDGGRLVTLNFVLGTYNRSEFTPTPTTKFITPQRLPTNTFGCLGGNDGNYCAFAEFKTVIYVSKDQS